MSILSSPVAVATTSPMVRSPPLPGNRGARHGVLLQVAIDLIHGGLRADDQAEVAEDDGDISVAARRESHGGRDFDVPAKYVADGEDERTHVRFLRREIGQHDAWIEQTRWIEAGLDGALRGDLHRREALGHELPLLGADSVLTGDRAAQFQCSLDDLVVRGLHFPWTTWPLNSPTSTPRTSMWSAPGRSL